MSEAARIHYGMLKPPISDGGAFRWSALFTGGALALLGLSRRSRSGVAVAAAGGLLSYAGAKVGTRQRELIAGAASC